MVRIEGYAMSTIDDLSDVQRDALRMVEGRLDALYSPDLRRPVPELVRLWESLGYWTSYDLETGGVASNCLHVAQAVFRLRGDHAAALGHLRYWQERCWPLLLRMFELAKPDCVASIHRGPDDPAPRDPLPLPIDPYHSLACPLCVLLLSGDRKHAMALAELARDESVFLIRQPPKDGVAWRIMVLHWFRLLRGERDRVLWSDFDGLSEKHMANEFRLYYPLAPLIAKGDVEGFKAQLAVCEADFRKRGRSKKNDVLDLWGYGKIGQVSSIDLWGTALCRLAAWSGMPIDIDTELYPKAFHRD